MARPIRRAPRFDCRGVASVQKLPTVGPPIPARIEKLSERGCQMELKAPPDAPLDLKLDEKVELLFEVHQTLFRILARARSFQSKTMVGFEFCDAIERRKSQLKELIGELRAAAAARKKAAALSKSSSSR